MITGELKSKVDRIWDTMWSGDISNPLSVIEQPTHHIKDAIFVMPTPRVLAHVVDQLDAIDIADRDTKGDLYEYMLGKIASARQNGSRLRSCRIRFAEGDSFEAGKAGGGDCDGTQRVGRDVGNLNRRWVTYRYAGIGSDYH